VVGVEGVAITGWAGDDDGGWRLSRTEEESCFWSATPSRTALLGRDWVVVDAASAVVISRGDDDGKAREKGVSRARRDGWDKVSKQRKI
jgi:hypothetical protein